METAFIDEKRGQAICIWEAPDQKAIEGLFAKAQVKTESIRQVIQYNT